MNKKIILLIFLSFLCLGMAGTGGFGPGISETHRLFQATIIDTSENTYQLQNISVDGSTFLQARTGTAEASIDFGKISTVRFYLQDEEVLARVAFVDDREMDFYIQPGVRFMGQTDWGRIIFQARNIRQISFR